MNRNSGVPRPSQRRFSTSEPSTNGMAFYLFQHFIQGFLKLGRVFSAQNEFCFSIGIRQVPEISRSA
jgi:hypothetical protein